MPEDQTREWYTVEQVADLFQVNPETVRRWIRTGDLAVLRMGSSNRAGYRIRVSDVEAFIAGNYGTQRNTARGPRKEARGDALT